MHCRWQPPNSHPMRSKNEMLHTIVAAALVFLWLNSFVREAQAEDVEYSRIGWWQIAYKEVDTLTSCYARSRFQDQTEITMALVRDDNNTGWMFFVYNPNWTWVGRSKQHLLLVAPINPNRIWRDEWSVNQQGLLWLHASRDFMNSIADAKALAIFNQNKRLLTSPPLDMKDSETAIRTVVDCLRDHPTTAPPQAETSSSYGTAFFVAPNLLLTNDHVLNGCKTEIQVRYPEQKSYVATTSGLDKTNDLALLHTDMSNLAVGSFRLQPRLGEAVATFGFPYSDILSSGGNFTLGNVTSLTGMQNDSRFIQMSTPIQPGNSGGPLLDMSGNVVGVVQSQLNAILMMQYTGSAPQDVNFAIRSAIVVNFFIE
jgi:serine protease Do